MVPAGMSCLLLLLSLFLTSCHGDPCTPSPCGENTRCYAGAGQIISCECLIGYQVPLGGDPFDGCVEHVVHGGAGHVGHHPVLATTTTEDTLAPLSTEGSIPASNNRLQTGHRPGQLLPRRNNNHSKDIVDVDTEELFPEGIDEKACLTDDIIFVTECLVHEDCTATQYCSPQPDNRCVQACSLDGEYWVGYAVTA